jgi:hypothetical protein
MSDTHEPVAWVAFAADASESRALFLTREAAERAARKHGWFVAELFAKPTLTDEEREAIGRAAVHYERQYDDYRDVTDGDTAKTLRAFLCRAK